jgi:hypothetical protein
MDFEGWGMLCGPDPPKEGQDRGIGVLAPVNQTERPSFRISMKKY